MRIRASKVDWGAGVRFYLNDGKRGFVEKLEFVQQPENHFIPEAGMLKNEDAQVLMDDLWNCGFRPTEGTGSAGALRATQDHLKDLQRLIFSKDTEEKGDNNGFHQA